MKCDNGAILRILSGRITRKMSLRKSREESLVKEVIEECMDVGKIKSRVILLNKFIYSE